jgi:hypothetical protein
MSTVPHNVSLEGVDGAVSESDSDEGGGGEDWAWSGGVEVAPFAEFTLEEVSWNFLNWSALGGITRASESYYLSFNGKK